MYIHIFTHIHIFTCKYIYIPLSIHKTKYIEIYKHIFIYTYEPTPKNFHGSSHHLGHGGVDWPLKNARIDLMGEGNEHSDWRFRRLGVF